MNLHDFVMAQYRADPAASRLQLDYLATFLTRWLDSGQQPDGFGALSSGERSALLLAVAEESALPSPLSTFLHLDPHLQVFVLEARGMGSFIGRKLGEIPTRE